MEDYQLKDTPLEKRVGELLRQVGMDVSCEPRGSKEDFILKPRADWLPQNTIVLEVKGKLSKTSPNTKEDLRQLDDRVFELSGEMTIRRRTLNAWNDPLHRVQNIGPPHLGISFVTNPGPIPRSQTHPNVVKGVLLFNGPTTMPFEERKSEWLGSDQLEFAEFRSFCVISLQTLIGWVDACTEDDELCGIFWRTLYETHGCMKNPSNDHVA
jgi:hypothetical protein